HALLVGRSARLAGEGVRATHIGAMNDERFRWRGVCSCEGVVAEVVEPPGLGGAADSARYVSFGGRLRAEVVRPDLPRLNRTACRCSASEEIRATYAFVEAVCASLPAASTRGRSAAAELALRRSALSYAPGPHQRN